MVMMQYSVMANNYWLLVEGIYLHSLLVITVFSEKKYFYVYLAIGWGKSRDRRTHGFVTVRVVALLFSDRRTLLSFGEKSQQGSKADQLQQTLPIWVSQSPLQWDASQVHRGFISGR